MAAPKLNFRLLLDQYGIPSLDGPRPLRLVANELIQLQIQVMQLQTGFIPPVYTPIDITGWTGVWVGKANQSDADGSALWNVAATLVTPAQGLAEFDVPKASVGPNPINLGFSEVIFKPDTSNPQIRLPLIFTVTTPGVTI